jgi:2-polyprenyl-3-methyl-5-hydroxy-6-metoxy-1,4-benzoquinol methylase
MEVIVNEWKDAQKWETEWWDNCINTYGEEEKQLLYAKRMGLRFFHNKKSPYNIDMHGKTVLDLGGGPVSLMLKCTNLMLGVVVDPILEHVPSWVNDRYLYAGFMGFDMAAEDFSLNVQEQDFEPFDEVWIYNVLQHTIKPRKVIKVARKCGKLIRIFEWLDTAPNVGHPHMLTERKLNMWLKGEGKVENLTGQANCVGACYYGIFPT